MVPKSRWLPEMPFATKASPILSLGRSHRVPRLFRNRLQKWRMYRFAHLHRALRRLKIRARHSPFIPIFSGAKNATISIAIMLLTVLVSCAFAGSQKRDFPEVLVTEDATPDNTLEIGPGWNREHDASDFNFEASIEKKLSENTSVEVTMTYDSITPVAGALLAGIRQPGISWEVGAVPLPRA